MLVLKEQQYEYESCAELEKKYNIIKKMVVDYNLFEKEEPIVLSKKKNENYSYLVIKSKVFIGNENYSPDILHYLFKWYEDYYIEASDGMIKISFTIPIKARKKVKDLSKEIEKIKIEMKSI